MTNIQRMYLVGFLRNFHLFGGVLVPMLTVWGGISFTTVLLLQSLFMFCVNIFEIPTGLVADLYGRKVSMFCGLVIATGGFIIYTRKPELPFFIVGEITLALGSALISGSDKALLYDSLVEQGLSHTADKVQARLRSFQMLGLLISTPLGSILGYTVNLVLPMQITAITTACAAICVFTLTEAHIKSDEPTEKGYKWKSLFDGVSIIRNDKNLVLLSFDLIVTTVLARPMIWLYQPLIAFHGFPIWTYGFVHAGSVIVEVIVMNNTIIMDKLCRNREGTLRTTTILTMIGYACAGISIVVAQGLYSLVLALIGIVMVVGFGLSREPLFTQLLNERIPSRRRTTTLSTINMLTSFGSFVINPITGVLTSVCFALPFGSYGFLLSTKLAMQQLLRKPRP